MASHEVRIHLQDLPEVKAALAQSEAAKAELRGRINIALSVLNQRRHHPADDALVGLVTLALEGGSLEQLLEEATP